jgi:hypothetical protein
VVFKARQHFYGFTPIAFKHGIVDK